MQAEEVQLDCTINTFGYGSNHNSDMLEKLADRFDGMYYFIKDAESINEGFATCLGGLMSTVATNLQLSVIPLNGAGNVKILNDFPVSQDQGTVTTNLGDIQSEEKRHIVFVIDLPKVSSEKVSESYSSLKLSYENTITFKSDVLLSSMELSRETFTGNRSKTVDEQYNRVVVAKALEEADNLGRAGNLKQARASIDTAMATVRTSQSCRTPMSRNLVSDMTETMKGYATLKDFRRWGKQYTKQNRSCIRRERSVRVNDICGQYATQSGYTNNSQRMIVSQFNNSCSDDSDSHDENFSNQRTGGSSKSFIKIPKGNMSPRCAQSEALALGSARSSYLGRNRNLKGLRRIFMSQTKKVPQRSESYRDFAGTLSREPENTMSIPSRRPKTELYKRANSTYPKLAKNSLFTHSVPATNKTPIKSIDNLDSPQVQHAETKGI